MAGSIRKQGRESWGITVELSHDPVTGKRRRRFFSVRGTRKDADRALTAALANRDKGIDLAPARITLAQYLERWLRDYAEHNVARSTLVRYRGIIESHIIPTLGSIRLADLRPMHIQSAYSTWLSEGSRRDGTAGALSPRTVLHHHRLLSEALSQGVKWQVLASNPCDAVSPPRPKRVEMKALNESQVKRFLAAAKDEPLYAFFRAAVTTGARLGELFALRWQDVDLAAGRISINRTARRYAKEGYVFSPPKTHRSRRPISLDRVTCEVLQNHRRGQLEQRLLVGPAYSDHDLVFATQIGEPLSDSRVRTAFRRILKVADLPRIRFHDLRHTAATLLMKAGVSPKVVSERLGHSTIAITLDTYSHVSPDMQRDGAEALARMIQ